MPVKAKHKLQSPINFFIEPSFIFYDIDGDSGFLFYIWKQLLIIFVSLFKYLLLNLKNTIVNTVNTSKGAIKSHLPIPIIAERRFLDSSSFQSPGLIFSLSSGLWII